MDASTKMRTSLSFMARDWGRNRKRLPTSRPTAVVSERTETGGQRIVLWMYAVSVVVAGLFGYVLGAIVYANGGASGPLAEGPAPQYGSVGPITFQLNGPNLALFGMVAVGLMLGLGLAGIIYVSNRSDQR